MEPDQEATRETAWRILEEEFVRWCIEDIGMSEKQANWQHVPEHK